jgi:predicted Fe-S protein YdhL (DUF1289 family)
MAKPILYHGDDTTTELPSKWAICPTCEGCGTDRGASVECDGGGITASEAAELGDDFMDDYRGGFYDKPCQPCGGTGKVEIVDWAKMTRAQRRAWNEQVRGDREDRAIERMEREMGA